MTDFEQQLRTWWAKLTAWLHGGQPAEGSRKAKAALQDFRESETRAQGRGGHPRPARGRDGAQGPGGD